jgi:hypothetical protein
MTPAIHLKYRKIPAFFFLRVPLYAFWGKSKVFHGKESIPPITVKLDGMKIDRAHLSRFNKICSIKNSEKISLIYPITIVFPFFQRILSLKQAPLSMFNVLGKHLKIIQHRQIGLDEALDIFCEISGVKIVPKGLEIDLSAVIKVAGEAVWTATETFFYRGNFGVADTDVEDTVFESIPKAKVIAKWFLPGGNGFRFARISGDGNGIHYSKFYARLLGFKRDFAQPFLILGNTINHLINYEGNSSISLDVTFKGQFYYERNVTIKGMKTNSRNRFDIYSEGNDRPIINGILND